MKMPSETAMKLVGQFSWGSNVIRDGKMIGQQYIVAEAIDQAIAAERAGCAEIAHVMARAINSKSRKNKMDRHTIEHLVRCRDKILDRT